MTDRSRQLAHRTMDKACVGYDCNDGGLHTDLCDEITSALRDAEDVAYERAAQLADKFDPAIATGIRSFKSTEST